MFYLVQIGTSPRVGSVRSNVGTEGKIPSNILHSKLTPSSVVTMPRRYSGIKRLFFPFRFPRSVPNSNLASLSHSNEQAMCSDRMDQILEEAFKIGGRDKKGRMVLRIVGKFFPAKDLAAGGGMDALRSFLERAVFPQLGGAPCVVVYMHACVQRADNYPGVAALRSVYEALPADVRDRIPAVYFVHPGLQSRLFFATVGRFFFSAGLYGKLKYVSRLEFLWEYIRRGEMEVPEFVQDHDDELEHRPLMDYGLFESDRHHSIFDAPAMESTASMHSLRCIS